MHGATVKLRLGSWETKCFWGHGTEERARAVDVFGINCNFFFYILERCIRRGREILMLSLGRLHEKYGNIPGC